MPETGVCEFGHSNFVRHNSKIFHNLGEIPDRQILFSNNFVAVKLINFPNDDFNFHDFYNIANFLFILKDKIIDMASY